MEGPEPVEAFPDPEPPAEVTDVILEAGVSEAEQWGSLDGSPFGVPEGMTGGVLGGVLGGVVGGVPGGELVPVLDYDRPPRLLRQARPVYPPEAFSKKVEGTVVLEIVISPAGRVAQARVVESIPLLDEAALAAVREWLFSPAYKGGDPWRPWP